MKPAPLKSKRFDIEQGFRKDNRNGVFFNARDVAALKAWLEEQGHTEGGMFHINREDWKEGWSDVND